MQHLAKQHPCDQCYQRRVRCSAVPNEPCKACTEAQLTCTRERTRGKRGPKKSATKSKLARKQAIQDGSTAHDERVSSVVEQTDTADLAESEPNASLRDRLSYGRGRVQLADHHKAATVNQLADFILGENGLSERQSYSHWLWGLQHAQSPHHQNHLSNNSLQPTPGTSLLDADTEVVGNIDGTALAIATGLAVKYGREMVRCVDIYFNCLYHVVPIVHEQSFRRLLARPSQLSLTDRAFVLAFCAATELQNLHMLEEELKAKARDYGCHFLEQFLRLRNDIDYVEEITHSMVVTAFFAMKVYACLNKHNSAVHYLREGICKSMELGLHRREGVSNPLDTDEVCAQRAVALLFVTERATAILDNSNVLLFQEAPALPDVWFDETDRNTLTGFQCLFELLKLVDRETVEVWCSESFASLSGINSIRQKISLAQQYLTDTSFMDIGLNDNQRADVQVTQHWLRLIFWQVSMRLGLLSQWSDDPAFCYDYPIELGRDLCSVLRTLPDSCLYVHYYSIHTKIFEVAYSLMDVLMLSGTNEGPGVGELKELFQRLSGSPITNMTYVRILMDRSKDTELATIENTSPAEEISTI